jgi:putative hydrolase of the HAD superfamily
MNVTQLQTPHMAQLRELEAVVFDLGGVIATSIEPALRHLVDRYGDENPVSAAALRGAWWPLYRDATLGRLHPDALWDSFRARIALHWLPHGVEDSALLSHVRMREPSIPQAIASLKDRYRVGLLSNYVGRWARVLLERFGVLALFDAVLVSSEVGIRKPDATIYRRVCEELGVPPARAAYIGDEEEDMVGALGVGMLPIFIPGQDHNSGVGLRIENVADVLVLLSEGASA